MRGELAVPETDNPPRSVELLGGWRVIHLPAAPWRLTAAIAREQCGVITVDQLRGAGLTSDQIEAADRRGQLIRLHRGIYALGHAAAPRLQAEMAAVLAVGRWPTLTGLSVLRAIGVLPSEPKAPIDVASLQGGSRSRNGMRVHRYSTLAASQIHVRDGVPMTTVERALLDASDLISGRKLERALDEAVANHLTSRTKVETVARENRGRRRADQLLCLADARRPNSQTIREAAELALKLIREAGLPEPETEVKLTEDFTADFFFRDSGVAVEVDSFSFHGVIRENFNRDRRKDRAFRQLGIPLVRVTFDELKSSPSVFIADLAATIAVRLAS